MSHERAAIKAVIETIDMFSPFVALSSGRNYA